MSHKLMGRISQHSLICLILVVLSMDAVEAEEGIKQFNKCIACHTLVPGTHLAGPSLHGLRGRPAGSLPGFQYSEAISKSGLVWNRDTLSAFLENPPGYLPGNLMPFGGLKNKAQRDALIDYLLLEQ